MEMKEKEFVSWKIAKFVNERCEDLDKVFHGRSAWFDEILHLPKEICVRNKKSIYTYLSDSPMKCYELKKGYEELVSNLKENSTAFFVVMHLLHESMNPAC